MNNDRLSMTYNQFASLSAEDRYVLTKEFVSVRADDVVELMEEEGFRWCIYFGNATQPDLKGHSLSEMPEQKDLRSMAQDKNTAYFLCYAGIEIDEF